jgi:hypothetical protein
MIVAAMGVFIPSSSPQERLGPGKAWDRVAVRLDGVVPVR